MVSVGKTDVGNRFVVLPPWLDTFIFNELEAKYAPRKDKDLEVLKWKRDEILEYLGTYFPRTFAEAYCIFSDFFSKHRSEYAGKASISLFDFGGGTGGEAIGFVAAASEFLSGVTVHLSVLDGNEDALRCLERIIDKMVSQTGVRICFSPVLMTIDDFYDMDITSGVLGSYDFIITFKAIYEFVKAQQFEHKNPYEHFIRTFLPKLTSCGIICMTDLSTRSDVAKDWIPNMMDKAERACGVRVVERNEDFNEIYYVTHSSKVRDRSKITWRIYKA